MNEALKILHLEDLAADVEIVERQLKKSNIVFEKLVVDSKEEFIDALKEFSPDIIISDHSLPSFNSLEALKIIQALGIKIPFILVTATVSEEFAAAIMQAGAFDYILKDRLQRLPNAITKAMITYKAEMESLRFHNEVIIMEALMREAEKLAGFGSWQIDLKTGMGKWSEGALFIHGYEAGNMLVNADNFFNNADAADLLVINKQINDALNGNIKTLKLHFRITAKEGTTRNVISELLITRDAANRPLRLLGFSQDITERKKAEKDALELRDQKAEQESLKKDIKQVSSFVRHASHELRTPLATMLLETESALRNNLTGDAVKKVLESLKEEEVKMIDLTNSLLMLSQIEGNNNELNRATHRMDELMYDAIEDAKKAFRGIAIDFNFSVLPEDDSDLYMRGNEALLLSAFNNLIKNAYTYSQDKQVKIQMEANAQAIYVHFENSGLTLKREEAEKIFLPLVRGENALQKKGFGLGLSIVKKIAELHNGGISYSIVNQNINRFTLSFFK